VGPGQATVPSRQTRVIYGLTRYQINYDVHTYISFRAIIFVSAVQGL
jgi:hypothetical protein